MENEIVKFRDALEDFGAKDADSLIKDFEKIIVNEFAPIIIWKCNSNGCFKECYDVGEPNFIIKFASDANNTEIEEATFKLAIQEGFDSTFPKTIYIPLSICLPASKLESSGSYEYRYTYHSYRPVPEDERVFLNYVIIQRRVAETAEDHLNNKDMPWRISDYENNPIFFEGHKIPRQTLLDTGISSYTWMADTINRNGIDYFINLSKFLQNNHISDLHSRNIGYGIDGEPLIFDWL